MTYFAQLNEDGSFNRQITTTGDISWDANHYCPAHKLTIEEAEQFRVVVLHEAPRPAFDPITQSCARDGGEFVGNRWVFKWAVTELPSEQVAANVAAAQAALIASYTAALDDFIDDTAKADRWDNRITCVMRAGYPNLWQAKGVAFGTWMDACYALAYQIMAEVQAASRSLPTIEEFLAEMPVMIWPA